VIQSTSKFNFNWGRTSSRVTSHHLAQSNANLAFMSSSNRLYGLTCSQISGVSAA